MESKGQLCQVFQRIIITNTGTSLAVQWLRLRLPIQEVRVQSLVREPRSHMPRSQKNKQTNKPGASLVVQWLRIRLLKQWALVRALVREDPTCHRATKPVCHSYWACALQPVSNNYWAREPQLLKPMRLEPCALQQEKPPQWEARARQRRVAPAHRD